MTDNQIDFGSADLKEAMNQTYDDALLKCMDIVERDDFYGIVAAHGLGFFGEKLGLTRNSHVLDLGCGIGGPARYFARRFGCRVTGVDLSEFNCRTAEVRTARAGLDHLIEFVHGNAIDFPFPEQSFSHVFGCEALCYFPDKLSLYKAAWRVLKPGGTIAFLESACDGPVHLRTEELLGRVRYESIDDYVSLLRAAGFDRPQQFNTTELAVKDIGRSLFNLISRRDQVVAAAGEEVYFAVLEVWAEFIAYFTEGRMTHCGIIARKI